VPTGHQLLHHPVQQRQLAAGSNQLLQGITAACGAVAVLLLLGLCKPFV
jgi:hypothetical protein